MVTQFFFFLNGATHWNIIIGRRAIRRAMTVMMFLQNDEARTKYRSFAFYAVLAPLL